MRYARSDMAAPERSALIYLVDDEPVLLQMLSCYLARTNEGWTVRSFQDPLLALEATRIDSPDIIISDLTMPGMSGSVLLEHVRHDAPHALRILVSGYADSKAFSSAHQYFGKPFSFPDIRTKLQKALLSLQQFANPELRKTVLSMRTLPVLPQVYYELLSCLENPDSSYGNIAEILTRDSAISAKILQMANSPLFGRSADAQSVTDLQQAITILGTERVKATVLSNQVFTLQTSIPDCFIPHHLPKHRSQTAALAYEFAKRMGLREELARDACVAGLLHDLGRVVLIDNFGKTYGEICKKALQSQKPLTRMEEELLQMSQADIVGFLVSLWGMRDRIASTLTLQEKPWEAEHPDVQDTATAVYMAHYVAHASLPSELFEQPAINVDFLRSKDLLDIVGQATLG